MKKYLKKKKNKMLDHKGIDVIPSHHIIWHLHELDLPALLPKEIRSRP